MPHVVCLRNVHAEALETLRAAPGVTVEVLDPVNEQTEPLVLPPREAAILQARMREAILGPEAHLQ